MTRTLRVLACTALLSAAYTLSGCCTYGLDACINCAVCLISGPQLPAPLAAPADDEVREIGAPVDVEPAAARAAMSY